MKPLNFIGSSLDDLRNFPEEARKAAGFELFAVQLGLDPSDWTAMPGIGRGVREIRIHVLGEWRLITLLNSKMPSMFSIRFKRRLKKRISMILKLPESDTTKLQVSFMKPTSGSLSI